MMSQFSMVLEEVGLVAEREFDFAEPGSYAGPVKNNSKPKRVATPEEVVRLAKKMKWRDIHFPNGDVVTGETIREIFAHAEAGLKSEKQPKRKLAHATAS
ncbi:MAG: hypothetical protein HY674_09740 [Chloroflexi bacterium]|nr:hypothetical protein [Chloroflexota bacterium]